VEFEVLLDLAVPSQEHCGNPFILSRLSLMNRELIDSIKREKHERKENAGCIRTISAYLFDRSKKVPLHVLEAPSFDGG